MYQSNSKRQCLICHQSIDLAINIYYLYQNPLICLECLSQLEVIEEHSFINQYPMTVYYVYNEFFRKLLFQYKAQYDIALYPIFFMLYQREINERYDDYMIVPLVSSQVDDQRRGFSPIETMLQDFHQEKFTGLYKAKDYKQTKQKNRTAIFDILKIRDGHLLENQKVLIIDDVITSGNTIKAVLALIEPFHPQLIEIIVLSKKIDYE